MCVGGGVCVCVCGGGGCLCGAGRWGGEVGRDGALIVRLVHAAHVAVPPAWNPSAPGYRPLQLQLCLTAQPSQAPAVAAAAAAAAAWVVQQKKKPGTWPACLPAVASAL